MSAWRRSGTRGHMEAHAVLLQPARALQGGADVQDGMPCGMTTTMAATVPQGVRLMLSICAFGFSPVAISAF